MLFPTLDTDDVVQENDMLRFDASRSLVNGSASLAKLEIKPSKIEAAVDCTEDGILDFAYPFEVEIVTGYNDKIDFSVAGVAKVATLSQGSYTLDDLATEIASKMTAQAGFAISASVSTKDKFTLSAGTAFALKISTGANVLTSAYGHIGFTGDDQAAALTFTGSSVDTVERVITVTLTDDADTPNTKSKDFTIAVISERADALWSNDGQLKMHESEIMNLLPVGRSSFKYAHRRAQAVMLAFLDKEGYVDAYRAKITKTHIIDVTEVAEWAVYTALRLICFDASKAYDDVWRKKSSSYGEAETLHRDRSILRMDWDKSGTLTVGEGVDVRNSFCARR